MKLNFRNLHNLRIFHQTLPNLTENNTNLYLFISSNCSVGNGFSKSVLATTEGGFFIKLFETFCGVSCCGSASAHFSINSTSDSNSSSEFWWWNIWQTACYSSLKIKFKFVKFHAMSKRENFKLWITKCNPQTTLLLANHMTGLWSHDHFHPLAT